MKQCLAKAEKAYPMPWKAIVAPHAGYVYSGSVAASVYRSLGQIADDIDRVILLSPAHRLSFEGIATLGADGFETPLGPVHIAKDLLSVSLSNPGVKILPEAFQQEHGIETHIPFIKQFLPHAFVLPFVVGCVSVMEVSGLIRSFINTPKTLIVISTDLSHFLNLKAASARDAKTCQKIDMLYYEGLTRDDACGYLPLAGLLKVAQEQDWRVTQLDRKTSADASGNEDRVVGYCAYGFEPAETAALPARYRKELLGLVKKVLNYAVTKHKQPGVSLKKMDFPLMTYRRTFVTYTNGPRLRGCKGTGSICYPLVADVTRNATQAALADRRFQPVTKDEVDDIHIELSILSNDQPIVCRNEDELVAQLKPGEDGLTLQGDGKRAMFLPKVWDKISEPAMFVRRLKEKAGLGANEWPADMTCARHRAETFGT